MIIDIHCVVRMPTNFQNERVGVKADLPCETLLRLRHKIEITCRLLYHLASGVEGI